MSAEGIIENYKDLVRQYNILNQISKTVASTLDLNKILRIILTGVTFGDGFGFNRAFLFLIDRQRRNLIGRLAIGPSSEDEAWHIWGEIQHTNYSLEEFLNSEKFLNEPAVSILDENIRKVTIPLDRNKVLWGCLEDGIPRNVDLSDSGSLNADTDVLDHSRHEVDQSFAGGRDLENEKDCRPNEYMPYCWVRNKNLLEPELIEYIDHPKFCIIPLISRTIKVGILVVDNKYNKRDITDDDIKFLLMLGQFAASSIRNTLIYNDLKDSLSALGKLNNKLRYLMEYNEEIIESIPVSILVVGSDFKVTLCNENCSNLMNTEKVNIIGHQINMHSISIDGVDLIEEMGRVMQENKTEGFHMVNVEIDGRKSEQIFDIIIIPFKFSDENPEGVILIIEDVTNTVTIEKELSSAKKLSDLGRLSATVAHEIRNPLIAIGGYAIRLKRKFEQDREIDPEALDIIINEVSRLELIVNEILDYAAERKIENDRINLSDLLRECIGLAAISAEQNDISILFECGREYVEDRKLFIIGDYNKLKQALINILNNAVEASSKREKVSICVELGGIDGDAEIVLSGNGSADSLIGENEYIINEITGDQDIIKKNIEFIHIRVHNKGFLGGEDEKQNIFLPFYTTKDKGTGLGLSITRRIIEQHKGRIGVESDVEKGTTFTIILPLLEVE